MDNEDKMRDALAIHLDYRLSDVTIASYTHYGLTVLVAGSQVWAIGDDAEVADAIYEWTEGNLFMIHSSDIAGPLNLYNSTIEAIQENLTESEANEDLAILLGHHDAMQDVVDKQSRSSIATYDDEEVELESFGETFYAYRIN